MFIKELMGELVSKLMGELVGALMSALFGVLMGARAGALMGSSVDVLVDVLMSALVGALVSALVDELMGELISEKQIVDDNFTFKCQSADFKLEVARTLLEQRDFHFPLLRVYYNVSHENLHIELLGIESEY